MGHGLHSGKLDYHLIGELKPDIVICQIGIVDSVRRAYSENYTNFIGNIRGIGRIHRRFASTHHFFLTRIKNVHKVPPAAFRNNIARIIEETGTGKIFFIRIANAGEAMRKKIYRCQEDIDAYNAILSSFVGKIDLLDPYYGHRIGDYILPDDGHHLTLLGHDLVFFAIDKILNEVISN